MSLAPSSAWHSRRGPCPAGTGRQSICPENKPPGLRAARHILFHSGRAGAAALEGGWACAQPPQHSEAPPRQASFPPCGWHRGCVWNRYGATAIGLRTRINVFVNFVQVRGESLAGQSYRQLVTLHFSPRASAKFGFFSIAPLNLKIKNKQ